MISVIERIINTVIYIMISMQYVLNITISNISPKSSVVTGVAGNTDVIFIIFSCLFQSLVLISKLPYVTFFHSLLKIMAPEYFEKQEPCLEAGTSDYLSLSVSLSVSTCLYVSKILKI